VAWLGATLGVAGSLLFTAVLLPSFGTGSRETASLFEELGRRMAIIGEPMDEPTRPVISNFPIWLAETQGAPGLALPNESPKDVLDLARTFDVRLVVLAAATHGQWPAVLDTGAPGAECFRELDLGPGPTSRPDPLTNVRVYEIVCP
jgi:hypothetical protein